MESCEATLPVRGRPREFDVEQALSAALRVFWSKGYEGASLTDLTEAMGITRPSLYAAFGNKDALFRKSLDLYEREKLAYVSAALDAPTSREVAERLLRGALKLQTSNCDPKGCLGVMSAVACQTMEPSVKADILAKRAKADKALIGRFKRAQDEGDLPPNMEPCALARYLTAIMQGMAVQAGAGASCADLEQLVETSLAIWPRSVG